MTSGFQTWGNKEVNCLSSKSKETCPPGMQLGGEDLKGKGDTWLGTSSRCEQGHSFCSLDAACRAPQEPRFRGSALTPSARPLPILLEPRQWTADTQSLPPLWCPSPCPHLPAPPFSCLPSQEHGLPLLTCRKQGQHRGDTWLLAFILIGSHARPP